MTALIVLMLLVQTALLCVAIGILRELRCVRGLSSVRELTAEQRCAAMGLGGPHISSHGIAFASAYAIWSWRGSSWELDSGSVPAGHEPGKPPAFQGTFAGQRVKTECTRR